MHTPTHSLARRHHVVDRARENAPDRYVVEEVAVELETLLRVATPVVVVLPSPRIKQAPQPVSTASPFVLFPVARWR
jgi:hypothetical protein